MITLLFILEVILFFYLLVAFGLFVGFMIRGVNVTLTKLDDNSVTQITGKRKILICFGLSLIWPIVLKFN